MLSPIIALLRPLEARYPRKSDLWLLARPFFTVSGPSLITKQLMIMQLPSFQQHIGKIVNTKLGQEYLGQKQVG